MNTSAIAAVANSVRSLTIDAVEGANSGHPGLPMGCAELGALVYGEIMHHWPQDPHWINRDRFVLSAGHGCMLLYSLLHLSGYDLSLDDIKGFRHLGSRTPGHPEWGHTPGVEATGGPLGQGISNAVGMAIAERILAARFNTSAHTVIDHTTFVLASDGDMMEGVSGEACSLAGHLGLGKLIVFYDSNHITVRDSYFYGASPTSEGYGVDSGPGSANNLAENNIFQHLPTANISESSCCNVFGYNYAVDNYYNNGAPNWQQQDGFHHGAGDYYILWEGHEGSGFDADAIHGTSFMFTHFRDYLSGHDPVTVAPSAPNGPKNQATFAYFPFAYNRYNNVVGSVLGTSNYHTIYQTAASGTTDCGTSSTSASSVFVFGYGDQAGVAFSASCIGAGFTIYNDPLVASTLMRWGNYAACNGDAACNAVRWQSSETASGAPTYPGLSIPSQNLPSSFYLSAQPAFWGSMPWPAVGPDVSGGNIPNAGGHAYHNPAATCYLNVLGGKTDGSSGPLNFDASKCYSQAAPMPPSNVNAVAH